jgi:NADPH:quinone reductase-like Zn-dependent oxidoreductase
MRVGDRVAVFCMGSFTTSQTVPQDTCVTIPDDMTFEEGSVLLCVYATAIHCLLDVARLSKDMVRCDIISSLCLVRLLLTEYRSPF